MSRAKVPTKFGPVTKFEAHVQPLLRHCGVASAWVPMIKRSVAVVVCLVIAGCGGGDRENTFEREGISFTFPEEWEQRELEGGPVSPDASFAAAFAPEEGLSALIFEINESDITVTQGNLDGVLQEVAASLDESSKGPTKTSVAGLPALRFESYPESNLTRAVTFVFDGKTWYAFNCGFTAQLAEEMKRGCEQAVSSFQVE